MTEQEPTSPEPSSASSADETRNATAPPERPDLRFDEDGIGEKLRAAPEAVLDRADFGIIRVDDEGVVRFYNQTEAELSGIDPEEVVGRNFFTQIAPCTNNRLFRGRFREGVREGAMDETFSYTYTYKMRPTLVDVRLYRGEDGSNWILVQKYGQAHRTDDA